MSVHKSPTRNLFFFAGTMVVALFGVLAVAFTFRDTWLAWLGETPTPTAVKDDHPHGPEERVKLTQQAQSNLRLTIKPVAVDTYRRTIQVPGVVVHRRGKGDLTFVAAVAGVVKSIAAYPGDLVEPGQELVTLRINSESLQASQTELYKAVQETKIAKDQKKRLEAIPGAIPEQRIVDLQYQMDRLAVTRKAYRADLALKGLLPPQLDQVEEGNFIKEIVIRAPLVEETSVVQAAPPDPKSPERNTAKVVLELEDLKVQPGEQVTAGQALGHLSNHLNLYIEGRGFREDTALMEKAAAQGWSLVTQFLEEKEGVWPPLEQPLKILYLANNLDPTSQTFPFYVPLPNQFREYTQKGRTYRVWRFRPGQRVQLGVPVQEFKDVFVLPLQAIVREGADVYVFRQNGGFFDRKPVRVLYEDSTNVVIANDGSIFPGNFIAMTGAEGINRALKAQTEKSDGGHGHSHAGHSH